jgi:hypothetical protein
MTTWHHVKLILLQKRSSRCTSIEVWKLYERSNKARTHNARTYTGDIVLYIAKGIHSFQLYVFPQGRAVTRVKRLQRCKQITFFFLFLPLIPVICQRKISWDIFFCHFYNILHTSATNWERDKWRKFSSFPSI